MLVAPNTSWYVPAGHARQNDSPCAARMLLYVPGRHAVHTLELVAHDSRPNQPLGQARQAVYAPAPLSGPYRPWGQQMHASMDGALATDEYVPSGHSVHRVLLSLA